MGDEALNVFNILQIVNTARTPVQPAAPIVFELPDGAQWAPACSRARRRRRRVAGKRVTVAGPFAPGATLGAVRATPCRSRRDASRIQQKLPVALDQFSVIAQKVGGTAAESPQIAEQREMPPKDRPSSSARGRR